MEIQQKACWQLSISARGRYGNLPSTTRQNDVLLLTIMAPGLYAAVATAQATGPHAQTLHVVATALGEKVGGFTVIHLVNTQQFEKAHSRSAATKDRQATIIGTQPALIDADTQAVLTAATQAVNANPGLPKSP